MKTWHRLPIPNFISSKFSFGNVNDGIGMPIAIHHKLYRIKTVNATGMHSAPLNGRWCGDQRPPCGLSGRLIMCEFLALSPQYSGAWRAS